MKTSLKSSSVVIWTAKQRRDNYFHAVSGFLEEEEEDGDEKSSATREENKLQYLRKCHGHPVEDEMIGII